MSLRSCLVALVFLAATGAQAGKSTQARRAAASSKTVSRSAKADEAESAYGAARTSYYALKGDKQRKRLRHNWLNVASRFLEVAKRYPKSARAPDALFTAAELQNELSGISRVDEDLRVAISAYSQLVESHPRHTLADDAALALAKIYLERLNRPQDAQRVLRGALTRLPKGDMRGAISQLLKTLGPEKVPAEKEAPAVASAPRGSGSSGSGNSAATNRDAAADSSPEPRRTLLDAIAALGVSPEDERSPGPPSGSAQPSTLPASAPEAAPPTADIVAAPVADGQGAAPAAPPAPVDAVPSASTERPVHAANGSESSPREGHRPIRRIVIDPGHGGHDSGAVGRRGTLEKDVALSISKRLAALLRDDGYEVVLTREDDRFIPLDRRAQLANAARGDLFLSIHCNAAKSRKLRGIETYTLNVSSDRYAIRLAARENSATEEGLSDLQFILADLNTKANTEDSSRLAQRVQESLVGQLRSKYKDVKDLGTKEALFYVLLGAKMPAILVETSFVSNPDEEKRLASGAYQQAIARAIAQGISTFASGRRVAKID